MDLKVLFIYIIKFQNMGIDTIEHKRKRFFEEI